MVKGPFWVPQLDVVRLKLLSLLEPEQLVPACSWTPEKHLGVKVGAFPQSLLGVFWSLSREGPSVAPSEGPNPHQGWRLRGSWVSWYRTSPEVGSSLGMSVRCGRERSLAAHPPSLSRSRLVVTPSPR